MANRLPIKLTDLGGGAGALAEFAAGDVVPIGYLPVVGSVSQSGGAPTGAMIETGTNANGTYTKYACGKLVCLQPNGAALDTNLVNGAIYSSTIAGSWTYPAAFVGDLPFSQGQTVVGLYRWVNTHSSTLTTVTFRQFNAAASTSTQTTMLRAEGRWFV